MVTQYILSYHTISQSVINKVCSNTKGHYKGKDDGWQRFWNCTEVTCWKLGWKAGGTNRIKRNNMDNIILLQCDFRGLYLDNRADFNKYCDFVIS